MRSLANLESSNKKLEQAKTKNKGVTEVLHSTTYYHHKLVNFSCRQRQHKRTVMKSLMHYLNMENKVLLPYLAISVVIIINQS